MKSNFLSHSPPRSRTSACGLYSPTCFYRVRPGGRNRLRRQLEWCLNSTSAIGHGTPGRSPYGLSRPQPTSSLGGTVNLPRRAVMSPPGRKPSTARYGAPEHRPQEHAHLSSSLSYHQGRTPRRCRRRAGLRTQACCQFGDEKSRQGQTGLQKKVVGQTAQRPLYLAIDGRRLLLASFEEIQLTSVPLFSPPAHIHPRKHRGKPVMSLHLTLIVRSPISQGP